MFTLKIVTYLLLLGCGFAWFNDDRKVRLEDVKAITLHDGQWTTGRRNPPVPQLKCVGGSAFRSSFKPQVVQCQNVGSDGFDIQWECKCDMDDSYRFGRIQVSCEGYDYPNDPYILKGSCGLEYTLEYTEKGQQQSSNSYHHHYHHYDRRSSSIWSWKFLIVVLILAYIIFKTSCGRSIRHRISRRFHRRDSDSHSRRPSPNTSSSTQAHKREAEYQTDAPPSYDDATFTADEDEVRTSASARGETPTRSGFWHGVGLGGVFGYLFGTRNTNSWWWPNWEYWQGYSAGYRNGWNTGPTWGSRSSWGSSWGSVSSPTWFSGSSGSSRPNSSTSRTASGFGGTSRR